MAQFQCSVKLSKYLTKVEIETSRSIEFRPAVDLGTPGMIFAFKLDPSCILIMYKQGTDLGNLSPRHEQSIAHEAIHGYLVYKLGYLTLRTNRKPTRNEVGYVNLLFTMIDDIVVNNIIQKEGFPRFSPIYLSQVEIETKEARKRSYKLYNELPHDLLFKDMWMVLRYIIAWGLIRYCDLEPYTRKIINKYLKAFQKSYAKQFTMADQIRAIILQHDIFNAHGHSKTVEAIAKLWHLHDLVGWQNM